MKIAAMLAVASLLFAAGAGAEPWWAQIGLTTTTENAPKVVAAADRFMGSEAAKAFPGRLLLQVNTADGYYFYEARLVAR